jgi:LemA protein
MIILLILVAVIGFYVWSTYNRFATLRVRIRASIQEIGNQLKRQADLIPNLVDSVKGYLKHEKEIFKQLTDARKTILDATEKGDPQAMVDASAKAQKIFGEFRALAESTPQLRGVESVNKLMDELRDTADKVMYARRTLIDLTADYNTMRETFPSNIIAQVFKFEPAKGLQTPAEGEFLTVSPEETKTPKANL